MLVLMATADMNPHANPNIVTALAIGTTFSKQLMCFTSVKAFNLHDSPQQGI